jgi:release factor glutamine methyltransferase
MAVTTETWTVLRMILWSAEYLAGKGVDRARLDAEHLLAHALGLKRLDLYLQHDRPLEPAELDTFRPMLKRRAAREPLQYVLGHQPFRELDLAVDRRVLIPRPETEVLVGAVLEWAAGAAAGGSAGERLDALDVGTGSGAIALSLATEGPFERVVATDLSGAALEVAAANRAAAGLDERVELRQGGDFGCIREDERFDVIVSNPPYVAQPEAEGLEPEVVAWEPAGALFAGPDGLDVIRRLIDGAPRHLREGGLLALEVGADQPEAVAELLGQRGAFEEVVVRADLTGRGRVVLATRRANARIDRKEA